VIRVGPQTAVHRARDAQNIASSYMTFTKRIGRLLRRGLLSRLTGPRRAFVYFQDQLDDEESVFRANVATRKWIVYQICANATRRAAQCLFSGVAANGSLYVMVERGATEIYAWILTSHDEGQGLGRLPSIFGD